ncbi:MAG: uroporphyrinogen-III C-methyltransferase [Nitrospinota bacterium]|nr:uroporphyrinogen-III C-methyltransferase [Nitrospinota bacterium]
MPSNKIRVLSGGRVLELERIASLMEHFPDIKYRVKYVCLDNDRGNLAPSAEEKFTKLKEPLLNKQADIFISPAKDVPYPLPIGLDVIAFFNDSEKSSSPARKIKGFARIFADPMEESLVLVSRWDRADLKVLFSGIDIRSGYGKVYLIGAGAGRQELLTIEADKILKRADIIYYDNLLDKRMLDNYQCRKKYVGKRKGKHSIAQEQINEMLYKEVLKGSIVVHLKGGDPFIFGRVGEEIKYLQERLVAVEVIPGASSASVAASSTNIPLTMRGVSNKLKFLSGHSLTRDEETKVYFMGATKLKDIKEGLIKSNHLETPVALVENAGEANERVIITNLDGLDKAKVNSPAIIIIGKVVGQFQRQKRFLFTGLDPGNVRVQGRIVHYPLIKTEPVDFKVSYINSYGGIIFTSKMGVKSFCSRYRVGTEQKIVAIGPHTKRELEELGYKVDYIPEVSDSDELARLIKGLKIKNFLYPSSDISDNKLHALKNVTRVITYRTEAIRQPKLNLQDYDGVIFSSPSTVDSFFKIYNRLSKHLVIYVYGKTTAEKLKGKGYEKTVQNIKV